MNNNHVGAGNIYVRSDVYGFFGVLLEMLTGLRALDINRPSGEHNLVEYANPSLSDKRKLKKIMDPRLEGQYPAKVASQAGELIVKCLESDPKSCLSMDQVLETLEKISAIESDPKKVRAKAKHNSTKHREESSSSSSDYS
ncbi:hypothetical protein Patl1_24493 [Pistacia atlantica]|uniref:Uncharacterized protein n=1 Tax=Pistacia atlantica TaxID=434234 RepID=A0ACC0ZWA1_9ROSI|nr:hypothetical protein Patl1_24493 [Pistacia atlantica]